MATFHFRTLSELTTLVKEHGRILYPSTITFSFGSFSLDFIIDDPKGKDVINFIDETNYNFQDVNEKLMGQIRRGDIRRQFLTETGDNQFFFVDDKTDKLFLVSQKQE